MKPVGGLPHNVYCVNIMVGGKERGIVVIFSFAQPLLEYTSGHGEMEKQTNSHLFNCV